MVICAANVLILGFIFAYLGDYSLRTATPYVFLATLAVTGLFYVLLKILYWKITRVGIVAFGNRTAQWSSIRYVKEIPGNFRNLTIVYGKSAKVLVIPTSIAESVKFRESIKKYAPQDNVIAKYIESAI